MAIHPLLVLPLLMGCPPVDDSEHDSEHGDDSARAPPLSYAQDIEWIVEGRCTDRCHRGTTEGGLDLVEGFGNLVGVPSTQLPSMNRVEPGDARSSYLWHKLQGTQAEVGGTGLPMGVDVYPEHKALIRDWIDRGARP